MSRKELVESRRLQAAIEAIENAIFNAGSASFRSTNANMLVKFLDDAKRRAESLELSEKNITEEERRKANNELAAVAYLVAKETALNEREREQYGIFLLSEFFTKSDFTELDQFYASAWDRLTEEGKAQMSYRIWEGVRRDEYQFIDLPDNVKEKEAKRLYEALRHDVGRSPELSRIPAGDSQEFMKAWDDGRKEDAYRVLDRPAVAGNVSVTNKKNEAAIASERADIEAVPLKSLENESKLTAEKKQDMGQVDFTALNVRLTSSNDQSVSPARLSDPKLVAAKAEMTPGG